MSQGFPARADGCHFCNTRAQAMSCRSLPSLPYLARYSPMDRVQSSEQLKASRQSSRSRGSGLQVQCVQALERPTTQSRGAPRNHAASAGPVRREVPDSSIRTEDLVLPKFDKSTGSVELIIAGAGPSGLAVAERVSQAGSALCRNLVEGLYTSHYCCKSNA